VPAGYTLQEGAVRFFDRKLPAADGPADSNR
jgi:hypothetical protein